MPTHLFHYTNIESLALILESRKLRLSRLDKVDDLSEGRTNDFGWYDHYIFVTCWTDDQKESLPFWSMYTHPRSAVRIKMPINMFKSHSANKENEQQNFRLSIEDSPIAIESMLQSDYTVMPCKRDAWYNVEYTDDLAFLEPKILVQNENQAQIALGKLGKYKSSHWAFQSEYRFRLMIFPFGMGAIRNSSNPDAFAAEATRAMLSKQALPIEYFFLDLEDSALRNMEITLGPACEPGAEIAVRALLEKYAPGASINGSVLTGKVALKR